MLDDVRRRCLLSAHCWGYCFSAPFKHVFHVALSYSYGNLFGITCSRLLQSFAYAPRFTVATLPVVCTMNWRSLEHWPSGKSGHASVVFCWSATHTTNKNMAIVLIVHDHTRNGVNIQRITDLVRSQETSAVTHMAKSSPRCKFAPKAKFEPQSPLEPTWLRKCSCLGFLDRILSTHVRDGGNMRQYFLRVLNAVMLLCF